MMKNKAAQNLVKLRNEKYGKEWIANNIKAMNEARLKKLAKKKAILDKKR